jgi:hypothetical protein
MAHTPEDTFADHVETHTWSAATGWLLHMHPKCLRINITTVWVFLIL